MVLLNTVVRWLPKGHAPPRTSGGQKYDQVQLAFRLQMSFVGGGRGGGEEEVGGSQPNICLSAFACSCTVALQK